MLIHLDATSDPALLRTSELRGVKALAFDVSKRMQSDEHAAFGRRRVDAWFDLSRHQRHLFRRGASSRSEDSAIYERPTFMLGSSGGSAQHPLDGASRPGLSDSGENAAITDGRVVFRTSDESLSTGHVLGAFPLGSAAEHHDSLTDLTAAVVWRPGCAVDFVAQSQEGTGSTVPYIPTSMKDPRASVSWRGSADDPHLEAASLYVGDAGDELNFVGMPQEEAIQGGSGASSWPSAGEECGATYIDIFTQEHELLRNATVATASAAAAAGSNGISGLDSPLARVTQTLTRNGLGFVRERFYNPITSPGAFSLDRLLVRGGPAVASRPGAALLEIMVFAGVLDSAEGGALALHLARKHRTPLPIQGGALAAAGLGSYGGGATELYNAQAVDEGANDAFELLAESFEQQILRNAGPDDEGLGFASSEVSIARERRLYTLAPGPATDTANEHEVFSPTDNRINHPSARASV